MTVDVLLQQLALTDYIDKFHAEQIDLDALVSIIRLTCSLCLLVFCAQPRFFQISHLLGSFGSSSLSLLYVFISCILAAVASEN